jgi:hypothetical protein
MDSIIHILLCRNSVLMLYFKVIRRLSVYADWKSYGKAFFNLVGMPSIVYNGALMLGNYESHKISTAFSEKRNYVSLMYAALLLYLLQEMIRIAKIPSFCITILQGNVSRRQFSQGT